MREPELLVVRSGPMDQHAPGGAEALSEVLMHHWPRTPAPDQPLTMTVPQLLEMLTAMHRTGEGLCTSDGICIDLNDFTPVILVCWHGSEPLGHVGQLADMLLRLRIPAVFTVQRMDETWARFETPGLLVEPMEIAPRELATKLHAFQSHAQVITEVRGELRSSLASQGGMKGQINQLHEEMNLASTLQRGLMTHNTPAIEGLETAVLFRPAAYVSGDLFNLTELEDGRLAFLLADAVGHGVPAALLTMLVHRVLTETRSRLHEPQACASTIAAINTALANAGTSAGEGTRFATAVFGIYDPASHHVSLSVAGHPPPLRMRPGTTSHVDPHGPLLGVFDDVEFSQEGFTLQPGETLLIYSDGFEVAFPVSGERSPANEHYLKHFASLAETATNEDSIEIAMADLEAALDLQHGSLHQADDITAIALRRPMRAACARAA